MKLAITADVHLTSPVKNPERYHALQTILTQMCDDSLSTLIIAGDLFDAEARSFGEFESICNHPNYRHIAVHIIPGNHDMRLDRRSFAIDHIHVYSEPTLHRFDEKSVPVLFLPYKRDISMGEALAPWQDRVKNQEWILIAHGDWIDSMREPNPLEPGVYMPLLRTDVESLKPAHIFLGHVHKPTDRHNIHYPGSPCALDITESGKRRFLIFDTDSTIVKSQNIQTDVIYFNESLIVLPVENLRTFVRDKINTMIKSWNVNDSEKQKIRLRLKVSGYTANRDELKKELMDAFSGISFYDNDGPDLSEVSVADDVDRAAISAQVQQQLQTMQEFPNAEEPTREQVFLHALKTIYET